MDFIASYHSFTASDICRRSTYLVFDPSIPDDDFKVQALILLTLASYADFDRDLEKTSVTK